VCLIKLPVNIFFHTAIRRCFLILHFEFMLKFTIKKINFQNKVSLIIDKLHLKTLN